MKDGLLCGIALGMIAGALLYKHSPDAKQFVNKTEEVVKNEMDNITKPKKTSKKSN